MNISICRSADSAEITHTHHRQDGFPTNFDWMVEFRWREKRKKTDNGSSDGSKFRENKGGGGCKGNP